MAHTQNSSDLFVTPFGSSWIYTSVLHLLCDGFVLQKTSWIWELVFLLCAHPSWLQTSHTTSSPSVWSMDNGSCLEFTWVGNGYNEGSSHLLTAYQMDCVLCHQSRGTHRDDVYMGLSSEAWHSFLVSLFFPHGNLQRIFTSFIVMVFWGHPL